MPKGRKSWQVLAKTLLSPLTFAIVDNQLTRAQAWKRRRELLKRQADDPALVHVRYYVAEILPQEDD